MSLKEPQSGSFYANVLLLGLNYTRGKSLENPNN